MHSLKSLYVQRFTRKQKFKLIFQNFPFGVDLFASSGNLCQLRVRRIFQSPPKIMQRKCKQLRTKSIQYYKYL